MTHLYELRCDPDDSAGLRDEIRRRDKIIESLMHQVEHSLNAQDTDYALMQSTFLLEEQVRDRTGKLDATMRELHKLNLKLAQQQAAAEAARSRLQLAVGSSTDGFALFDAADRLDLANRRFSEVLSLHASPVSIPENAPFEQVLTALRAAGHDPAWTIQWRDLHARARQGEKVVAEVCLGEDLWIRITENLASDNSIVGTYADISEMKQREHRRHETDLELERAHLIHAVGNISQGISMIDGDLKLVVCNPRFLELLDFPPALGVPGTPFAAFLRYNAERGEYGPGDADEQVRTRMQQVLRFEPHVFERERPDGTIIEIVGKPLPEGGFITTYTDISERRDAEDLLRRQYEQLETLVDNVPSGITLFNGKQELVVHNAEFRHLLDLPDEMFANGPPTFETIVRYNANRGEYGPGDQETHVRERLERARQPSRHHFERVRPNGTTLDVRGAPLSDGGFVTIYTDITNRKHSEERQQLADMVFAHSPTGIIIADNEQRILSANPAFTAITGLESFEIVGHTVDSLPNAATASDQANLRESLAHRGLWSGELEAGRKNGETFTAGIRVSRVDDPQSGKPTHYIWLFSDITERKRAEERVRHMAQHDPLTGLPNRLALLVRLNQVLPEARRHGWKVAVMFLDLDRFKIINDTLGHQTGDDLLREVASRLAATVRDTDMVARIGGDEFVILLPDISSVTDAAVVAGKIIAALSVPIQLDQHELHTTPSIGISIFPTDGPDGDTVVKNADTAMYHAKSAGRNNYQFYAAEMNLATTERLNLENKLRQAIKRNELALVYQPQFDVGGKRPTGVEALLRWHHPSEGVISPARFIPIAEETGLIVNLGEWVLMNACREVKRWIDAGLPPIRLAVNVSARQLKRRDFCDTVAGALVDSGLPPDLLELEITESAVMENPQEAIGILQVLRRMGVTLAIDDFGTGYSSLAYLKLFPIDRLKIDRSFVRDIEQDLNDRAIAFGTIALAHSLGLSVIAEGVETEDQLELLASNGCDEVQGFLFSRPLSSAAAFSFLHAIDRGE